MKVRIMSFLLAVCISAITLSATLVAPVQARLPSHETRSFTTRILSAATSRPETEFAILSHLRRKRESSERIRDAICAAVGWPPKL